MYQIHRYARFNADGSGLHWGALLYEGSSTPPVPPPDHAYPDSYIVPMDDHPDHWHRLHAEAAVHGHCAHATHSGGVPHPVHAHVRLGGTIAWSGEAHPEVAAHAAMVTALTRLDLVRHLGGPHLT